jgi:hypothetical protein
MNTIVQLDNGTTVKVSERVLVNVDPQRDLHGPSVVRAANGDLLLCHQDSNAHRGGEGFVHQWRSSDGGFSWEDEGPVADWRDRQLDALFGEYGLAPDGSLVMVVQRRQVQSADLGIIASWLQTSTDHGKTWQEIGPVDDSDEYAVMFGRALVTTGDIMQFGAWSRLGNALYQSTTNGRSWDRLSVIFPNDHPDFTQLVNAGPPFYPHVVPCPDGSLLALTYHTPPLNHCFSRRSADSGVTWGPIVAEKGLPLWAPRMRRFDSRTLIVTGRDIELGATVAWFSTDSGNTWNHKLVVDKPAFTGSYAYSDSIDAGDGQFWVFTSSPQSEGKGDIIGVLLEIELGPAG